MSTMSSKIDDLPNSNVLPPDIQTELEDLQKMDTKSNIKANIKKVSFQEESQTQSHTKSKGFFEYIQSEINEENVLLIVIFIIASLPYMNNYINKIPFIGEYATTDLLTAVLKSFILFVIYIICKFFILPKLKL